MTCCAEGPRDPGLPGRRHRPARATGRMQRAGEIPASVVWKVSAMLAPSNPLTLRQLERLGASTINVPSDVTLGQLAEMRRGDQPADRPVRGGARRDGRRGPRPGGGRPDRGGRADVHEVRAAELQAAVPQRPAPGRRGGRDRTGEGAPGRVALEWIERSGLDLVQSGPAAKGLGVPEPRHDKRGGRCDRAGAGAERGGGQAEPGAENAAVRRMADGDDEVALQHRVALASGLTVAGRAAGDRHRQLGQRAEPVQPAAARAGRRGARGHRGGRRHPGRVPHDLARRGPDEAERHAVPQPAGHRDRGDDPGLPAGRHRHPGQLRQDRARRDDGRGQRGHPDGDGHRRCPRPAASSAGSRIGAGTALWRLWDERRAGRLDDAEWRDLEACLGCGPAPATRWAPRPPWRCCARRSA